MKQIASIISTSEEGKVKPLQAKLWGVPRLDHNLRGSATRLWRLDKTPALETSIVIDVYAAEVNEAGNAFLVQGEEVLFSDLHNALSIRDAGGLTPALWDRMQKWQQTPVIGGHRRFRPGAPFGGLKADRTSVVPGYGPCFEERQVSVLDFYQSTYGQQMPIVPVNELPRPEFMIRDTSGSRWAFTGREVERFSSLEWPINLGPVIHTEAEEWMYLVAPFELKHTRSTEEVWFGVPCEDREDASTHFWSNDQYNQVAHLYTIPVADNVPVWSGLDRGQVMLKSDHRSSMPVMGQPAAWPDPAPTAEAQSGKLEPVEKGYQ